MPSSINDDGKTRYCTPIERLISETAIDSYTTDSRDPKVRAQLDSLTTDELFDVPVVDPVAADCCLSGLWLLHNYLDESHEISQDIKTPDGSYWHGIMHRLERDYWNSKYWFGRIGRHPALLDIARHALIELNSGSSASTFDIGTVWNPSKFTDFVEAEGMAAGQRLAYLEWQGLFDHCYFKARGE